jgi:formylglycine-generating enzyme required for sulfatase activity
MHMQPNEPEADALVLGSLPNARAWDAVLGGTQGAKRRLLRWQVKDRITVFEFETVTVNAQGQEQTRCCQQASSYREYLNQQVSLEMVAIPGGTFLMGAAESCEEGFWPYLQHRATVAPFFISKYPVTQAQWIALARLAPIERELPLNPSYFRGSNHPVEQVSWYEAREFCARLSRQSALPYRLPNEIEWEYACRGRTLTPFHFGPTITTALANYNGTHAYQEGSPRGLFRRETTPVGSYNMANSFGLFDMHGLVWEWCNDEDDEPFLPIVLRGGSWRSHPRQCHSSFRCSMDASALANDVGFRVVCTPFQVEGATE